MKVLHEVAMDSYFLLHCVHFVHLHQLLPHIATLYAHLHCSVRQSPPDASVAPGSLLEDLQRSGTRYPRNTSCMGSTAPRFSREAPIPRELTIRNVDLANTIIDRLCGRSSATVLETWLFPADRQASCLFRDQNGRMRGE